MSTQDSSVGDHTIAFFRAKFDWVQNDPINELNPQDLDFKEGDIISLIKWRPSQKWYKGKNLKTGAIGNFPINYVTELKYAYLTNTELLPEQH